jgi:hypothetical protein
LGRRLAIAALLAAVALPSAMITAEGGPLEPFRRVFKEPADTLKGIVSPKAREAQEAENAQEANRDVAPAAPPAAEAGSDAPPAAPEPAAPTVADTGPAVAAGDMPLPRLRPEQDDDMWAIFTNGPDAPPLDVTQHEDAIEALIAGRSLGEVHKAANPPPDAVTAEAEAIAAGQPLGYATPGDDIAVLPNLRPKIAAASATATLDEERSTAVSGVLRPGGSCTKTLTALGVVAVSADPIRSGACGIAAPVEVASLGGGAIQLTTKAMVNCDVASTLAAFMRDAVDPIARQKLGSGVTDVRIAATYACRPRNGVKGAKLSEHAKGNAVDISAFKVKGEWIVVGGKNGLAQNAFLKEVRKAACGPFTTVLGPGSDAYHSDHFHFDLAKRGQTGRGLYCR